MARILVVDDDPNVREVVRRMLRHAGHDVQEASDGTTAFQHIRREAFDLVVTDMLMPDTDGIELLNLLAKLESARPPVLAMSGGMASWSPLPCAEVLGASHILPKPFTATELLEAVEHVLAGAAERS